MTEEQIKARIGFLNSQVAEAVFSRDLYDRIGWIVRQAIRHFNDIDFVIFDLEEQRVQEINTALSRRVFVGDTARVRLSLLDLFDLERLSLLAERDLSAFRGGEECQWSPQELAGLTKSLERVRELAFPFDGQNWKNG